MAGVAQEIAPGVTRVAVLRDAAITSGSARCGVIQAVAPSLGIEVGAINVGERGEIERAVAAFASSGGGGLIVSGAVVRGSSRVDHRASGKA